MLIRLLLALLLATPLLARAQPEAYNWRFGEGASLTFPNGGAPVVNPPTRAVANEGCASISDGTGTLQCYTNGMQVWDRTDAAMPNGSLTGSNTSSTQAALLLPAPGQAGRYYLFTVDAQENAYKGGLRYSTVNMALRGGLGDVELPNSMPVAVPANALLTEKLTAVRHANGQDYWIVVHSLGNDLFYSYPLSASGLGAPVSSQAGWSYFASSASSDAVGYLRASPNGQLLAAAALSRGVEVFNFDKATGRITLRQSLTGVTTSFHYGLEFSPDNTKLYVSSGTDIRQIDLANNYAAVPVGGQAAQGLQRGPDGRIYVVQYRQQGLSVIESPNLAGAACNVRLNAVNLGLAINRIGLPNFPNDLSLTPALNVPAAVCIKAVLRVAVGFVTPGLGYAWSFGDGSPAVAGPTATHTYAQAGTYSVTLTATPLAGGPAQVFRQPVQVVALPTFSLGATRQAVCAGRALTLAPIGGARSDVTYRWQDGLTEPTRLVQQAGRYVLTATTLGGCSARDSVEVTILRQPQVTLAPPATLCPKAAFVLLQPSPQPAGTTYRWQDGATTATYPARRPGRYRLEVRTPEGCLAVDSVEVRGQQVDGECEPILIPNVITPNGDLTNDTFVLQGLLPNWDLKIFDRWGREIYQRASYDNSWAATGQAAGLYYYYLRSQQTGQILRGWVEVVK